MKFFLYWGNHRSLKKFEYFWPLYIIIANIIITCIIIIPSDTWFQVGRLSELIGLSWVWLHCLNDTGQPWYHIRLWSGCGTIPSSHHTKVCIIHCICFSDCYHTFVSWHAWCIGEVSVVVFVNKNTSLSAMNEAKYLDSFIHFSIFSSWPFVGNGSLNIRKQNNFSHTVSKQSVDYYISITWLFCNYYYR